MNISLAQYRAVIGLFNGARFKYFHNIVSIPAWMFMLAVGIIIRLIILLVIMQCNDVEVNPGPTYTKFSKLKICHANVRSLTRAKLKDIQVTLADAYDIITLSETHLTAGVLNNLFELKGFHDIIRKDRQGAGGGVAIFVRNNIMYKRKIQYESGNVEAIWLDVNTTQGKLLLCCCYRPPTKPSGPDVNVFWDGVASALDNAHSDGYKNIVILGDLNADPHTIPGRMLLNLCNSYNFTVHISEPTRITSTSATVLDQVLSNVPSFVTQSSVLPPIATSDHCVVSATLNFNVTSEHAYKRHIWEYDKADFNLFRNALTHANFDECFESSDIDIICESWTSKFLSVAKDSVPNKIVTIRPNDKAWFTSKLRLLKRRVNRAFNKFKQVKSTQNQDKYKTLSTLYHSELDIAEYEYKRKISRSLHQEVNCKRWCHKAKTLMGKGEQTVIPLLKVNNNYINDNKEKAEAFNTFFLGHSNIDDSQHDLPTNENFDIRFSDLKVSEQDVHDQIRSLNCSKSCGPDGVTPKLLFEAGHTIVPSLTKFFNISLNSGKFPQFGKMQMLHRYLKKEIVMN